MSLNQWIGIGRLTRTPELKTTQSGTTYCNFSVAVNRQYVKGGEQKTDFINVTAWRQTSEFVCKYFEKGDPIQIIGKLQTRKYTNQNGAEVTATEIVADNVGFVEGYKRSTGAGDDNGVPDFEDCGNDLPFDVSDIFGN